MFNTRCIFAKPYFTILTIPISLFGHLPKAYRLGIALVYKIPRQWCDLSIDRLSAAMAIHCLNTSVKVTSGGEIAKSSGIIALFRRAAFYNPVAFLHRF